MTLDEHLKYLLEPLGMNPMSVTHQEHASRIVFEAFSGTVDRLVFSGNEGVIAVRSVVATLTSTEGREE